MTFYPLALLVLKLATRLPKAGGFFPLGFYVRQALIALKADDLDAAMEGYQTACSKDSENEKVKVLREVLASEIRFRRKKLLERLPAVSGEEAEREVREGVGVLERFLERLGFPLSRE